MSATILPMPGNEALGQALAKALGAELVEAEFRKFPDGESYVRIVSPIEGKSVALVDTLKSPDDKALQLVYTAATAKDLGARRVGLVAPYLAYMRQDRRFHPGEAVTSTYFGRLLGNWVDWLVTVDPHLHRRASLAEIYDIPTKVVHAAPFISDWIVENVERPVLVGPDRESEQWVSTVADRAGAPYLVLTKTRHSDRHVEIDVPDVAHWNGFTPVLVDDIVSTAQTMIVTVRGLREAGLAAPVCIGVHAVFAGSAFADLQASGVARIVTCNTIPHETNAIDLSKPIGESLAGLAGAS